MMTSEWLANVIQISIKIIPNCQWT